MGSQPCLWTLLVALCVPKNKQNILNLILNFESKAFGTIPSLSIHQSSLLLQVPVVLTTLTVNQQKAFRDQVELHYINWHIFIRTQDIKFNFVF